MNQSQPEPLSPLPEFGNEVIMFLNMNELARRFLGRNLVEAEGIYFFERLKAGSLDLHSLAQHFASYAAKNGTTIDTRPKALMFGPLILSGWN